MVSYIGGASGSTTATIPTHAIGDYLHVWAYNGSAVTNITVPAGFTSIGSFSTGSTLGLLAFKIATATNDTSGTWTNATDLTIAVYRPGSGKRLYIGQGTAQNGASATATYPAITYLDQSGSSWAIGSGWAASAVTTIQNAPTGMTARLNRVATNETEVSDTNSGGTGWSAQNVALGSVANWTTSVIELKEVPPDINGAWDRLFTSGGTWAAGDREWTATNGNTCYSTDTNSSGLHYVEITAKATTSTCVFGVVNLTNTVTYYVNLSGQIKNISGTTLGNIGSFVAGTVIGIAHDLTGHRIWFRKIVSGVAGSWNATSASANDPSTGIGGIAVSTDTYRAFMQTSTSGADVVLQTGPYFIGTIPSGYSDWFTNAGDIHVSVTGQALTTSVGTITATGKANVSPTGNAVTAFLGSVTVGFSTNVTVNVTGNSATVYGGTATAAYGYVVHIGGLPDLTASGGAVTVNTGFKVNVTGQSVTASVGSVLAGVVTNVNASGNQVTASLGNVTLVTNSTINVTGNAMTVSLGDVSERFGYRVTGLSMTVSVGMVEVINWHEIPNVPSIWTQVVTE